MTKNVRSYARSGKLGSEKLKNYGNYTEDFYLERVIEARLKEGWSREEIIVKYGVRLGKMS